MSDYRMLREDIGDDDALDEEVDEEVDQEDEEDDDERHPMELLNLYAQAGPERRNELWGSLEDSERDLLRKLGVAGPVTAEADGFVPVEPGQEGHVQTLNVALARMREGVRDVQAGRLDETPRAP